MITFRYRAVDGYSVRKRFKAIKGARKYVAEMIGANAEIAMGGRYAVSSDGVGKIIPIEGATIYELLNREKVGEFL